ncbi:hypothetical protein [Martelella mediterranea]|uniref:hypothetical protein n=1 Tax=Martelella mediterranea TaxID=293089 RepID=UPI0010534220|nr:hypothetical protein [Martelella mediterranea]
MSIKSELETWIIEALRDSGGNAAISDICKHIWEHHEHDLRASGKPFYTWQYDMRWVGQDLQNSGQLKKQRTYWELLK